MGDGASLFLPLCVSGLEFGQTEGRSTLSWGREGSCRGRSLSLGEVAVGLPASQCVSVMSDVLLATRAFYFAFPFIVGCRHGTGPSFCLLLFFFSPDASM